VSARLAPWARPAARAAVLLAVAGAAAAAGAGPVRIERLAHEYGEHRLAVRPDLATRAGDRRGDDRLEPVTQASLLAEAEWLEAFARRLESVPPAGLTPAGRVTRDSLTTWAARARAEIATTRRWERDPAAYLELADAAIRALLEGRAGSTCARSRAVARRLGRVPDVLRAARINLREPPRDLVAGALPGYERLLGLYRTELPGFGARCREPRTQADLAEADTLAVRAVEDFLSYLREDLLPRAAGARAVEHALPR
jgi:hypothetical protein